MCDYIQSAQNKNRILYDKKDGHCTSEKNAYTCHKIGKMIECLQYEETYGWREENGYIN